MRRFGPKPVTSVHGNTCPICGRLFAVGDYTTLVALSPAGTEEEAKRQAGEPYNSVAMEVCWLHVVEAPHVFQCACTPRGVAVECEPAVHGMLLWYIQERAEMEETDAKPTSGT